MPARRRTCSAATAGELLAELEFPEPWASDIAACLELIDHLNTQIAGIEADLRREGADHPYVPLLHDRAGDRLDPGLHHRRRDR